MARIPTIAGSPVAQHTSPNASGTMSDHRGLVLHIAQGTYQGTIAWQLNPDQRYQDGTRVTTCSTWIVGRVAGEVAQMADTDTIAWCQRAGSRTWLSVELAGFAPNPPTEWQVEACAHLLAWMHREHQVPLAAAAHPGQRGLGHHSMDREFLGEQWGHDECPGAGVIAAKPRIVARATAIVEGDDMSWTESLVNDVWPDRARASGAKMSARDRLVQTQGRTGQILQELAGLRAMLAAFGGQDLAAAVRAELDRHRGMLVEDLVEQLSPALVAELGPALAQTLGGAAREVPVEVIEGALTRAVARIKLAVEPPGE